MQKIFCAVSLVLGISLIQAAEQKSSDFLSTSPHNPIKLQRIELVPVQVNSGKKFKNPITLYYYSDPAKMTTADVIHTIDLNSVSSKRVIETPAGTKKIVLIVPSSSGPNGFHPVYLYPEKEAYETRPYVVHVCCSPTRGSKITAIPVTKKAAATLD